LVLGVVISQGVDTQDASTYRFTSIVYKVSTMIPVIAAAIVVVLGGLRLAAVIKPVYLFVLGIILVGGAIAIPTLSTRFYREIKDQAWTVSSFLPFAVVEFVGAVYISIGLRRLIRPKGGKV
jgi:hypothetical protein